MSTEVFEVDFEKLTRMLLNHVRFLLIDLRSKNDYSNGHVRTALNFEKSEVEKNFKKLFSQKDIPIVFYSHQMTSALACAELLTKKGYLNAVYLNADVTKEQIPKLLLVEN